MRRPKAPVSQFVTSPHNYAGGKARLLHRIIPEFGDLTKHTFIDLFAGGLNVGLNVDARKVVFNDQLSDAVNIARYLSDSSPGQVEAEADAIIAEYQLSDSQANGYEFYETNSSRGLAAANREPFLRLRQDVNERKFQSDREQKAAEFMLIIHAFNCYLQRSNVTGLWTTPVGKRDFNGAVRSRLQRTVHRLGEIEHEILQQDFQEVVPAAYESPFVYLDPPYALGSAPYNTKWGDDDDERLLSFLDDLTAQGVPWAMSNVLRLKGEQNDKLTSWAQLHEVIHLDFDYSNSSHRRRDKGEKDTDEVLIMST